MGIALAHRGCPGDFNGDAKSDLVIANDTTGDIQLLQMNGLAYTAYQESSGARTGRWSPRTETSTVTGSPTC